MHDTREAPDMSYIATTGLKTHRPLISKANRPVLPTPAGHAESAEDTAEHIDIRQLRHHTKNTLQRLIGLLADVPGLTDTPAGEALARELEYRICLSAQISNALFGLTHAPGSMADRLRQLAGGLVEMMRQTDQIIRIGVSVKGCCPASLREAVIRSANELIGNAVKHGMKGRPTGRIAVRLITTMDAVTLTVTDNGWGFEGTPTCGEGLSLARNFAAKAGGTLDLDGKDGTAATLTLPLPAATA